MYSKLFCVVSFSVYLFIVSTSSVLAQVVINEFSSRGDTEWVELYNKGADDVDIANWTIFDEKQSPETLSGVVKGGEYFVFEKSKGWLNDGGDVITLENDGGDTMNSVAYGSSAGSVVGAPDLDESAGRVPDGSDAWQNNLVWTKGLPNPLPTPAPTSTPSPTPETTPAPTSTPSPTSVPTKTPTPKPTVKAKKTSRPTPDTTSSDIDEQRMVLGLQDDESPSPSPTEEPSEGGGFSFLAWFLILGGLGSIGFAGFSFFQSSKKGKGPKPPKGLGKKILYNNQSEEKPQNPS